MKKAFYTSENGSFSVFPCEATIGNVGWDVIRNSDSRIVYQGIHSRYEAAQNADTLEKSDKGESL